MGFCILVIYGTQRICKRINCFKRTQLVFKTSLLLMLSVLCLKTLTRNMDWQTRESLLKSVFDCVCSWSRFSHYHFAYRSGLRVLPNNAKLHFNYGNFLRDNSNYELAKLHYRKALELWPTYASAWNNLGTLIDDDVDLQEKHFLAAVQFSDQHINAHFNLGQLYR